MPMRVASTGERLGNKWCREREDVRAHPTNAWLAGDESGSTELHIDYLLEKGDRVLFLAQVGKAGPTKVGCSFVDVVRTPRETSTHELNHRLPARVVSVPDLHRRRASQRRQPDQRCLSAIALRTWVPPVSFNVRVSQPGGVP